MGRLNKRARRVLAATTTVASLLLTPSAAPGAARTITMSGASPAQAVVADLAFFYRRETRTRRASRSSAAGRRPGSRTRRAGSSTPACPGRALSPGRPARAGLHAARAAARSASSPTRPTVCRTSRARSSRASCPARPHPGRRCPAPAGAARSPASRSTRPRPRAACSSPPSSTSATPVAPTHRHVHGLRPGARLHRRHPRGVRATSTSSSPAACTPSPTRACRARAPPWPPAPTLRAHARVRHQRAARGASSARFLRWIAHRRHGPPGDRHALRLAVATLMAANGRAADRARDPRRQPPLPRRGGRVLRRQVGHLVRRDRPSAGAGEAHEAARAAARPVRALARDRRRDGLLQPQPAADRRGPSARRARTSAPACSPRSSATRSELGLDVETAACDAAELPFEDETFDLVLGHAVLHHLPDLDRGFARVQRACCKPGGTLFFAGEPSRHGRPARGVPQAGGGQGRAAVAQGDQGAPRAARTTARRRGRARARGRRRRPRLRPRRPRSATRTPAASPTSRVRGRGAAGELVRLVQPHAGGQRRAQGRPVGLDPVRLPRLHPAPARGPQRCWSRACRRGSSTT